MFTSFRTRNDDGSRSEDTRPTHVVEPRSDRSGFSTDVHRPANAANTVLRKTSRRERDTITFSQVYGTVRRDVHEKYVKPFARDRVRALTLAESDECGSLKSAHSFGLVLCQGVRVPAKYSSSYPNILATSSSFGFSESMSSLSSMASVA